jgi:hypothetical protein
MVIQDNWISASLSNRLHPETFFLPGKEFMDALKVGDSVKISNDRERFWVVIDAMFEDGSLVGTIENNLITTSYTFGDKVKFKKDNVFEVHKEVFPEMYRVAKRCPKKKSPIKKSCDHGIKT